MSVALYIDAREFDAAAAKLAAGGFDDLAQKEVNRALIRSANVVRENVRLGARRHHRTGKLEAGIHTTWAGAGLGFKLRVMSDGREARWILGGVRPHAIPKIGISDRPMPIGGMRGFAEHVQHPGFRGDPYVSRGVRQSFPAIRAILKATVEDIAEALAKLIDKEK